MEKGIHQMSKFLHNNADTDKNLAMTIPQLFLSKTVLFKNLPFPKQALVVMYLQYKSFENTGGKSEIACNKHFLLYSIVFSTISQNFLPYSSNLILLSANSFSLQESKIYRLGKGYVNCTKKLLQGDTDLLVCYCSCFQ